MTYQRNPRIPRICQYCKKQFLTTLGRINEGAAKHCSRACAQKGLLKPVKIVCVVCDAEIVRPPCRITKTQTCSLTCARKSKVRPLAERFWLKVDKSGDCWIWRGRRNQGGYGVIVNSENGKAQLAHRLSYLFAFGDFDEKLCVCHKCDTRLCVNPKHLFLGTLVDNNRDRNAKGRTASNKTHYHSYRRGERSSLAKITEHQVREIRNLREAEGLSFSNLASRFGLSHRAIEEIIKRKTWKHVL